MMHLVVTISRDNDMTVVRYYHNGMLQGETTSPTPLSSINDVNNWLGRSQLTNRPNMAGTYHEFRIYDCALTSEEIVGSFAAGPETVNLQASP